MMDWHQVWASQPAQISDTDHPDVAFKRLQTVDTKESQIDNATGNGSEVRP